MKTLLVDNYDSYTFNLFQLIGEVNGQEPLVVANDRITWEEILAEGFDSIVISPGPGHPARVRDLGVGADIFRYATVPVLGVCLGHQGLAYLAGGEVGSANQPMHGKTSAIFHSGTGLFEGLPQGFEAVRYHSLSVTAVPESLRLDAWSADQTVMALSAQSRPHFGVQFHPESVGTEHGELILKNFRDISYAQMGGNSKRQRVKLAKAPRRSEQTFQGSEEVLNVHFRKLQRSYDSEQVFLKLFSEAESAFWLDSSDAVAERSAAFSYMGSVSGPRGRVISHSVVDGEVTISWADGRKQSTPAAAFEFLEQQLQVSTQGGEELPFDFTGGLVGYLGHELKVECGADAAHVAGTPDALMLVVDRVVVFDHLNSNTYLVALAEVGEDVEPWFELIERQLAEVHESAQSELEVRPVAIDIDSIASSRDRSSYIADIERCQEEIWNGESYEVCLTNEFTMECLIGPFEFYQQLRRRNPAPYGAYIAAGGLAILSSSPESFLQLTAGGKAEARPIKGTRRRGVSLQEDRLLSQQLSASEKDRAENLMIVDLTRNDLGRVCEVGSVKAERLMEVESFATVHQLVSTVTGQLRAEASSVDCVKAMFPPGSMTGAPKLRTLEILDRIEGRARGPYGGALGFFGFNQTVKLSTVIRTAIFRDGKLSVSAGGAVVADSEPDIEYAEMLVKAGAVIPISIKSEDQLPMGKNKLFTRK